MRNGPVSICRWFAGLMLLLAAATAPAAPYNDSAALSGVEEGKGVFLFDFDNPKKLAFYLDIVAGSHANFKRQGVEPEFVAVFIGPTVKYLTTEPDDEIAMRFESELAAVAKGVKKLDELGVRLEVCSIANRVFGVDNDTVLPGMDVVGDGFVSLIGYQAQDYHLVPIF